MSMLLFTYHELPITGLSFTYHGLPTTGYNDWFFCTIKHHTNILVFVESKQWGTQVSGSMNCTWKNRYQQLTWDGNAQSNCDGHIRAKHESSKHKWKPDSLNNYKTCRPAVFATHTELKSKMLCQNHIAFLNTHITSGYKTTSTTAKRKLVISALSPVNHNGLHLGYGETKTQTKQQCTAQN